MSNNLEGPVILESTFNNPIEPGYFGTGGRVGEDSIGPLLSGGTAAELAAAGPAPAGSLYLQSDDASLLQQTTIPVGVTWSAIALAGGGTIVGGGIVVIPAGGTVDLTVDGAIPAAGDIVFLTASVTDTTSGGNPGATGIVSAANTVTVTVDPIYVALTAAPTGDGRMAVLVIRV